MGVSGSSWVDGGVGGVISYDAFRISIDGVGGEVMMPFQFD